MRKVMKSTILATVLALFCTVMFSGCELFAFFKFGKALADYNYVYVKNNTSSTIKVDFDEDEYTLSGDEIEQDISITLKANETNKKKLTGGYFTVSIGNKDVLPSADMEYSYTNPNVRGYYLIPAHTLMTINENNGTYTYTITSRD